MTDRSEKAEPQEQKFTAEQIENGCPERLQQISREIEARLSKADKQAQDAHDHLIAVDQLLAEAKNLCDRGGFNKFRELFCPQLGKSQAYELLAIAAGKKTLAQHRTEERDRKRKTRARQKAAAENSGTVPEESQPADDPAPGEDTNASAKHEAQSFGRRHSTRDEASLDFTARVLDLIRRTSGRKPERFGNTSVPPDALAKLGQFLIDLAKLRKSHAKQSANAGPNGNDVPTGPSAEEMKAKHAANDDEKAAA